MISDVELKRWLQRDLTRAEKVLVVLSAFDQPTKPADIKIKAEHAGCRMSKWNLADILAKAKGVTIKVPAGYEVADRGRARLKELGLVKHGPHAEDVANDLRVLLASIKDDTAKSFVEEAVRCYEASLYRSAIVMAWLAAVFVLQREVVINHLQAFNNEAKRIDPKWKPATSADDLGRLRESDFLDRLAAISVIGKNVKTQLISALNLRNGCGHPNSLKVGANAVASHLEMLLLNVFQRFVV